MSSSPSAAPAAPVSDGTEAQAPATVGATFVLVHPAWHGGWCWKKVAPILRAHGHDVYTPTLTGLGERSHLARPEIGLDTHVEDVASVLAYEDLTGVVLVGHSSSGAVITGVADRAPERIAHLVYVDAFVPEHGQALLDLLPPARRQGFEALVQAEGQGWLMPRFSPAPWDKFVPEAWHVTDEADLRWMLARLGPTPFRHFTDPVRRANAAAEALPRTYIRCILNQHPVFDRLAQTARMTSGWRYRELETYHHPAITHPSELADALLEVA